jgi:hypothetical protein
MILTEAEYAALSREWTRAKPFHPSSGEGHIWLVENDDNAWAVKRVEEMRRADKSNADKGQG